mmetsp:Transcript_177023/g.567729  ORF Transcript_177023/g.567729 Transcript_177023/m.567729 type:complete len:162 (-) Transcript_177023:283-768(-)
MDLLVVSMSRFRFHEPSNQPTNQPTSQQSVPPTDNCVRSRVLTPLACILQDGETHAHSLLGPIMVELGVDSGECSERLLSNHSTLRWRGVDIWDDSVKDLSGAGSRGGALLLTARGRLRQWLGSARAQMLISRSADAASVLCGEALEIALDWNRVMDLWLQ